MIDWNGYGWIAGEVTGPSTWFGDLTLEVPRGDVLAAAAVTEASVRVEEPEPGSVAVYVREYAQYDSAGKRTRIDGMKRLASHLTWWQMLPRAPRGQRRRKGRPAMDHIGIDVHKRDSQIYILAENGEIIERRIRF